MHPSVPTTTSLIISATDNSDALNLVLAYVTRQTHRPLEIFVVDESLDPQSATIVDHWARKLPCPLVRVAAERLGESRARLFNRVLRAASGDYIVFTEGDCLLHRRFLADHLSQGEPGTFLQGRRGGVRARYVRRVSTRTFHPLLWLLRRRVYGVRHLFRHPWPSVRLNDLRTIHGCNFSAFRADLVRVNGFNECFDETGVEMLELAVRLRNAGMTLRTITGRAIVYHLDHRYVARYRSLRTMRILEQAQRDQISRCERGLVVLSTQECASKTHPTPPLSRQTAPATNTENQLPSSPGKGPSERSHFRDEIVPRSMLRPEARGTS